MRAAGRKGSCPGCRRLRRGTSGSSPPASGGKNLAGALDPAASNDVVGPPGWIAASYDGKYMYAKGGEIISVATHAVVGQLRGKTVSSTGVATLGPYSHSRFILEVDFNNSRATRVSNQFGVGRVRRRRADPAGRVLAGSGHPVGRAIS